jgi:hypothetical protein
MVNPRRHSIGFNAKRSDVIGQPPFVLPLGSWIGAVK